MFRRIFFILLLIPVVCSVPSLKSYGEMFDDTERGGSQKAASAPLPEPAYQAYYGPKKSIAVTKFENKVKGIFGNWNLGEGFAEMLTTELIKTGRFVVVERQALQDIVGEQELGQTGLVRKETAAKVGELLGASIIVRGVVSEFEMNESGGGGGVSIGGVRLGLSGSNAHVAVDIRLVDTNTGQVLYSHNAVGKASSSGVGVGIAKGNVDFNAEGFKNTPLGQAMRQAIHDAVNFIVNQMEAVPFTALVIKADGNKVYINAGASMNIKPGDRLYAYSKGEEMIDPATGLNLGSEESLVGAVEVVDVKDKYSIGSLLSDSGALKRGDILKFR
jgi:curli biogenesis system outer membrane secretion channel CsgG